MINTGGLCKPGELDVMHLYFTDVDSSCSVSAAGVSWPHDRH